jgi:hypothetical protein
MAALMLYLLTGIYWYMLVLISASKGILGRGEKGDRLLDGK